MLWLKKCCLLAQRQSTGQENVGSNTFHSLYCEVRGCNIHHPVLPGGEDNGNSLQYSCLENPMGGGCKELDMTEGLSSSSSNSVARRQKWDNDCESTLLTTMKASLRTKLVGVMEFQLSYFKSWKMMLWKCCTQYASKFGKLSSGHRTEKGQFSFRSQRKAMPKNAQTTAQLHSSHILVK